MLTSATGEETPTPNPNKCNSTLTNETRGILPPPLHTDVDERGHSLRFFHAPRCHFVLLLFCFVCKKQPQTNKQTKTKRL